MSDDSCYAAEPEPSGNRCIKIKVNVSEGERKAFERLAEYHGIYLSSLFRKLAWREIRDFEIEVSDLGADVEPEEEGRPRINRDRRCLVKVMVSEPEREAFHQYARHKRESLAAVIRELIWGAIRRHEVDVSRVCPEPPVPELQWELEDE